MNGSCSATTMVVPLVVLFCLSTGGRVCEASIFSSVQPYHKQNHHHNNQRANRMGFLFGPAVRGSSKNPRSRNGRVIVESRSSNDDNNNDYYDTTNEWGIPNSKMLPPLRQEQERNNHNNNPHAYHMGPPQEQDVLPNGGKITLMGAGPGDPDLLTVAAYRLLTQADNKENHRNSFSTSNVVVIADRLVSEEILDLIPTGIEMKTARKLPGCAELAQEEIYWWVYQGLQQGKHVIRLKIGDPFVFGRGGEEVLTFRKFGIEPKVIPGVSAAFSAPLLGSIPVTHRGVSNQVVMCTGYGREGTSPDLIQYHKEQTIVFLMAVGRLKELCSRLMKQAGYPSKTPVAIVEKAGCPTQRTVVGTMVTIADIAKQHKIQPPSTIIVGDVVHVLLEKKDELSGEHITGLIQNMTSTAEGVFTV